MKKIIFLIYVTFSITIKAQPAFVSAQQIGGNSFDAIYSVAIDKQGNTYTTGMFLFTADLDPGAGVFNITSNGSWDIFVCKTDAGGNLLWVKSMGSWAGDVGRSVYVDESGNVYVTGYFGATVDFDPGPGVCNLTSGGYDIFISKFDPSGNFIWAKAVNSQNGSWNYAWDITGDIQGNIYVTGKFMDSTDFDPGQGTQMLNSNSYAIYILKLDSSGNFIRVISPGYGEGRSITTDSEGNVYTTGSFTGTADFDPGTGVYNLTAAYDNVFISKLDSSANLLWARQFIGPRSGTGFSIATDKKGNVYTTGTFKDSADFDGGAGTCILHSNGGDDIFVSKLDHHGDFVWAKRMGSSLDDWSYAIAVDDKMNVFTTGTFKDTVDFDPGPGVYSLSSAGYWDVFMDQLDLSGNFICAGSMGGNSSCSDLGFSIALDDQGNICLAGQFGSSPMDADPGPGIYNLVTAGGADGFIIKLKECAFGLEENEIHIENKYVFPNPSFGKFVISPVNNISGMQIKICNSFGEQINFKTLNNEIDISSEPKGIYFVEINADGKRTTQKIIVE